MIKSSSKMNSGPPCHDIQVSKPRGIAITQLFMPDPIPKLPPQQRKQIVQTLDTFLGMEKMEEG
jgi:hypothetical protein